jgi:hypothetical protein
MATKEIYQSANLTSSGVSVEENSLNAFSVAPNPAQNTVAFQFGDRTAGSFRVLNTLGQVVFAGNLNGENTATLNVSDWNNGLYVVEFTNGTEQSSQRFQVAH